MVLLCVVFCCAACALCLVVCVKLLIVTSVASKQAGNAIQCNAMREKSKFKSMKDLGEGGLVGNLVD